MPDGETILRTHGQKVWRTLWRLVGDRGRRADVEDCFQEVFVAALEAGRREEVRNWDALLRRIATAKGLDLLRCRIRIRGREAPGVVWEDLQVQGDEAGARLEREELAAELRHALARVKPREGELFCLRHLEGMRYEEIGATLGMSADAVGVALHRVTLKLRGLMEGAEAMGRKGEVCDE